MKKKAVALVILMMVLILLEACAPLRKPLDKRTNFSQLLKETENYIRQEEWFQAIESLEHAQQAWEKIKPILQVDIDHDYVNEMEDNFTMLKGYLETQEKPDALATILLLENIWGDIGEM